MPKTPSLMLVGITAIVCCAGCGQSSADKNAPPKSNSRPDPRVVGLFGGPDGFSVLTNPARVEAFRVDGNGRRADSDQAAPGGYPELAGPVVLSEESVDLLKAKLADANSYWWEMAKGCIFQPGVRFDFIRDDVRLQILVRFSCDELKVLLDGRAIKGEDIDPIRPTLQQVAKQAFPDDADIQALTP